ncbi:hypothetical protein COCSUDRAFT_53679 [Coccomyxa subellipsoidea C-169]|uniref:Uncharacterized protein n=1 Tax=Coccomyxa subellipsoidea (strain C-169) TaxID=574566 RepID=I0YWT5_COCSC|nr:hypothetical protein COCSUDRAFT_53679 [Coccomyxa subellipsoidea C-169]EIE22854.1 hypothetical protein COCSUDRAFT_53679 [Coccomyxa subellipsoidea C-169]|eukprot:XP_005647398.1 hypothetical protein COCSUDRAFT_53679 [Coccomyxa subellipsoidea C-169]
MVLGNLGTKLLQISRSTPYLTTALIGHKLAKHADANVRLIAVDPLTTDKFQEIMAHISDSTQQTSAQR